MSRDSIASTAVIAAFLILSPVCGALAQVGNAVAVDRNTTATDRSAERELQTGMAVSLGERIDTDNSGQAQLKFSDDTKLVVGPGSSLTIDEYVLASADSVSKFTVNALGGTFRFISGNSPKNAYLIDTPIATIGIRGTGLDFTIFEDQALGVTMMIGSAIICPKFHPDLSCLIVERTCGLTILPRDDEFDIVRDVERRNAAWQAAFPYMGVQSTDLEPEFRLPTYNCGHLPSQGLIRRSDQNDQWQTRPPGFPAPSGNDEPDDGECEDCEGEGGGDIIL